LRVVPSFISNLGKHFALTCARALSPSAVSYCRDSACIRRRISTSRNGVSDRGRDRLVRGRGPADEQRDLAMNHHHSAMRSTRVLATLFTVALLALVPFSVVAETFSGRVVYVVDGDTFDVLDANRTKHRVRIAGIDAPERRQPFYQESRENLAQALLDRQVIVSWYKRDRYGRLVAKVKRAGDDVGLLQVNAGLAWWYRGYAKEQTPEERVSYEAAEQQARLRKVGLWRDATAIEPWKVRDERKARRKPAAL